MTANNLSSPAHSATDVLQSLIASTPSVIGAVVATADGRAFAHAGRDFDPVRIAAISSSLLALSESFSREALLSQAQYNSVATELGTIMVVRIPTRQRAHVLCLWADKSDNFAMTLRIALDVSAQLADAIDG